MNKKILMIEFNILSVFDGISCGQQALFNCGIPYTKYYAAEIDQRAVKVTQKRWPKTIQYGDVTKIKAEHFMSPIHLLMGGSPCQGFSFAGKGLNFDDPRSKLFFEFVRLKKELNPDYFFLENVRMKKTSEKIITELLEVEPILVNSALVSAQNRKRLYWTNISGFIMPVDRGIVLEDVLEQNSHKVLRWQNKKQDAIQDSKKSACLKATTSGDIRQRQKVNVNPSGKGINGVLHDIDKKSPVLTTNKGQGFKIKQVNPAKDSGGKQPYITDRVYNSSFKGVALTCSQSSRYSVEHEDIWRDISVTEACRLQGLPDDYCSNISQSAAYHALGNGWQVDTIMEFFKHLPK